MNRRHLDFQWWGQPALTRSAERSKKVAVCGQFWDAVISRRRPCGPPRYLRIRADSGGFVPRCGGRRHKPQGRPCGLVALRGQVADYLRGWAGVGYSGHVRARVERPRVHEAGRAIVQSHRRAEEGERWALDRKRTILEPFRDAQHERRGEPVDAPDPARPARVVIAEPAAVAAFGTTRCGASAHPSPNSSVRTVRSACRQRSL